MSVITIDRASPGPRPRAGAVAWGLVSAEFLKARKRRGLVALTAILTVGAVVIAGAVLALLHAQDPAKYGPAGGLGNLANAAYVLSSLGAVAAVLVGATMGAGDLQAGVFRDLVATGRPRLALFAARIPGGLALLWPLVAAGWAVAAAGSVLLAGSHPRPGLAVMVQGGCWVLLAVTVVYLMALGLASLAGSRSATVGILLAWQLALTPPALEVSNLGVLREGLLTAALNRMIPAGLLPGARPDPVSPAMSVTVAVAVIAAWAIIPLAAGAWRTYARDA
jgi:ABC-type transport system involved in multi-copper enzyme maturation permease subunit